VRRKLADRLPTEIADPATFSLAEVGESLGALREITNGLNQATAQLNDLRKALTIATSLVDLVPAFASGNPADVLAALNELVTATRDPAPQA
jgi:ABC-type transporter Mla subunit MlaD